jgi:hypothetical protein
MSAAIGAQLAMLLRRCWRPAVDPTLACSASDIAAIMPRILATGSAGLIWRRVRESHAASDPRLATLADIHAWQTARSVLFQRRLESVIARLRGEGIEPIVIKGWAFERLYPERGMRSHGDIDLLVEPAALQHAEALFPGVDYLDFQSTLHSVDSRPFAELRRGSRLVPGPRGASEARVLSVADELRFACLHFFSHAASRPLWLCDIALLLEHHGSSLDVEACLSGSRRERDGVLCALLLARQLLGAELPPLLRDAPPAGWVSHAVLCQWGAAPVEPLTAAAVELSDIRRWWPTLWSRFATPLEAALARQSLLLSEQPPGLSRAAEAFAVRGASFARRLLAG